MTEDTVAKEEVAVPQDIEKITADLTQRGIAALLSNSAVKDKILKRMATEGNIPGGLWFKIPTPEKTEISCRFGVNTNRNAAMGEIHYDRFLEFTLTEPGEEEERGFIGYKQGDLGMQGGQPNRAGIEYYGHDVSESAAARATKFIERLESLS